MSNSRFMNRENDRLVRYEVVGEAYLEEVL